MTATQASMVASPQVHEQHRSLVARLWAVVLVFLAVALARSFAVGIPMRDPHGAFVLRPVTITLAVSIGLVVLDGIRRAERRNSVASVVAAIRARWTRRRLALAAAALLAYHVTYVSYHNLKSWNDLNQPRDSMLGQWDRWLFLGHSPAVLLHDLLGQHVAAWVLTGWYETFGTLVIISFPATVILARRMSDAYAGIAALVWVWILGTATYYAIPSLGPFHSAPRDFAGLSHTLVQDTQARYIAQRDHLLAHPHASDAFAQLGAFASLHVGVTAVILGIAWWNRMRLTTIALSVFLAGTIVATIYLGWHFAVDDLAGLAIAALAWVLGPLTVGVRRPPQEP